MPYKIDKKNHRIKITGSTNKIRNWIISLDQVITGGGSLSQLEEKLKKLEQITELKQFNFNLYERIYFDYNSILYVPNVDIDARDFWFPILEKHFEKARKIIEKKNYPNYIKNKKGLC